MANGIDLKEALKMASELYPGDIKARLSNRMRLITTKIWNHCSRRDLGPGLLMDQNEFNEAAMILVKSLGITGPRYWESFPSGDLEEMTCGLIDGVADLLEKRNAGCDDNTIKGLKSDLLGRASQILELIDKSMEVAEGEAREMADYIDAKTRNRKIPKYDDLTKSERTESMLDDKRNKLFKQHGGEILKEMRGDK